MIDPKKLEAIKFKKTPYLLISDREEGSIYSKVHYSLGNAKIGAHQERQYHGGRDMDKFREIYIFEWSGSEWVELFHIEAGTPASEAPWKKSKV